VRSRSALVGCAAMASKRRAKRRHRTSETRTLNALALATRKIGEAAVPDERAVMEATGALFIPFCEAITDSREFEDLFHTIFDQFTAGQKDGTTPSGNDLPQLSDPKWRAKIGAELRTLCALGLKLIAEHNPRASDEGSEGEEGEEADGDDEGDSPEDDEPSAT